ncbi:MAG TPA: 3-deoxy-7-phosphoheptulonate synthase [Bacteroidales bacterium]|jgi:3-deoxy-7-phosphoheptulonate synthase|nr:3-deoxy-7-phosphoheptulonate synthase [Bacteroidales bacterium]
MILHVNKKIDKDLLHKLQNDYQTTIIEKDDFFIIINLIDNNIEKELQNHIISKYDIKTEAQLSSREYKGATTQINLPYGYIGGDEKNTMIIAGPCAVESEKQILESAKFLKTLGINTLRAGLYKPRTSPYTFQGLGDAGLSILKAIKDEFNLNIVSEVRDITNFEKIVNIVDIVQIGAKAMYDQSLLKACGEINKPILLKRHFAATIEELIKAAEFILSAGNEKVILCERGIRTFETKTRFTLDLTSVAYLKKFVNLPIIVDPSHAMGYSYGVPSLAKASLAMGIDGLLIEVHPNPQEALSDSKQQLNHNEFTELYQSLKEIAKVTNKKII